MGYHGIQKMGVWKWGVSEKWQLFIGKMLVDSLTNGFRGTRFSDKPWDFIGEGHSKWDLIAVNDNEYYNVMVVNNIE